MCRRAVRAPGRHRRVGAGGGARAPVDATVPAAASAELAGTALVAREAGSGTRRVLESALAAVLPPGPSWPRRP